MAEKKKIRPAEKKPAYRNPDMPPFSYTKAYADDRQKAPHNKRKKGRRKRK
jgi:hypothetical protein